VIGYFITGTDTSVGKTYVTCALARRARVRNCKVLAFKPIETGCALDADGNYVGADQELLVAAAGNWQQGSLRGVYRLPLPAAPLVAATAAATTLDVSQLVHVAHRGVADHRPDLLLVEGAGGWRVPITSTADMATLAQELALPVLLIVRAGLGTINHTLLSVEAIERDGLRIAAVVMSLRPDDDRVAATSNRTEILRRWQGQFLVLGPEDAVLDPLLEVLPGPG
jgi:dethiobiotin synthetase